MSAGVVHAADGALQLCALIREDCRGPWPSADWSACQEAERCTPATLAKELAAARAPTATRGAGFAIGADLRQREHAAEWSETRAAGGADDAILLCGGRRVAIVRHHRLGAR